MREEGATKAAIILASAALVVNASCKTPGNTTRAPQLWGRCAAQAVWTTKAPEALLSRVARRREGGRKEDGRALAAMSEERESNSTGNGIASA